MTHETSGIKIPVSVEERKLGGQQKPIPVSVEERKLEPKVQEKI